MNPTQYDDWRKQLQASAGRIFDEAASKPSAREERQAQELRRRKDVVAEVTAENLELK
jgi:transposase-like protein